MGEWMHRSIFLDLDTSWRWVVSFPPRLLYPRGKSPHNHWIGGCVDPRVGLDNMEKWKFLTPPGLELRLQGRPASSQSLYRLHYPGSLITGTILPYPWIVKIHLNKRQLARSWPTALLTFMHRVSAREFLAILTRNCLITMSIPRLQYILISHEKSLWWWNKQLEISSPHKQYRLLGTHICTVY
jgi:hypothetical protein